MEQEDKIYRLSKIELAGILLFIALFSGFFIAILLVSALAMGGIASIPLWLLTLFFLVVYVLSTYYWVNDYNKRKNIVNDQPEV